MILGRKVLKVDVHVDPSPHKALQVRALFVVGRDSQAPQPLWYPRLAQTNCLEGYLEDWSVSE